MFFKKITPPPEFTVTEFIDLDNRLNDIILRWVITESRGGLKTDSKITEISIFNFKLIYTTESHGEELRKFIADARDIQGNGDYLFSRIQDLYIHIMTAFPKYFIDCVRKKHVETIERLGYEVDEDIAEQLEFGWLLAKIQHNLRYHLPLVEKKH